MVTIIAFTAAIWLTACRWAADAMWGLPPADRWLMRATDSTAQALPARS